MTITRNEEMARLRERMLSGEPFTQSQLRAFRAKLLGLDRPDERDYLVEELTQRLRRAGKIAFTREHGQIVWRPVVNA